MHILAVIIGLLLLPFCGIALKIGIAMIVNQRRYFRSMGMDDAGLIQPLSVVIMGCHVIGFVVGCTLIYWGLHWLVKYA